MLINRSIKDNSEGQRRNPRERGKSRSPVSRLRSLFGRQRTALSPRVWRRNTRVWRRSAEEISARGGRQIPVRPTSPGPGEKRRWRNRGIRTRRNPDSHFGAWRSSRVRPVRRYPGRWIWADLNTRDRGDIFGSRRGAQCFAFARRRRALPARTSAAAAFIP
jgi:hypothetical protein